VVSAVLLGSGRCPMCGLESATRFGWYVRRLQDVPNQGSTVEVRLKLAQWRCRNPHCERQTVVNHLAEIAPPSLGGHVGWAKIR
jgi:transposase